MMLHLNISILTVHRPAWAITLDLRPGEKSFTSLTTIPRDRISKMTS